MRLVSGEEVSVTGILTARREIWPASGMLPRVEAKLRTEDGVEVPVVWWEAGLAPAEGERVQVSGIVRDEYSGTPELHVRKQWIQRDGPPDDPIAQVFGFYHECVEAEAAGLLRVQRGGLDHLELVEGPSPIVGRSALPVDEIGRAHV